MTRLLFVLIFIMTAVSCSYVPKLDNILPDKRTEYKKSESLPDLEVPPDLTAEAINDSMSIPNEGASLSEYQKRRSGGGTSSQAAPVTAAADSDEQWISVIGNNENIWPRLRNFISEQGYSLDLDDAELGVLETTWSEASSPKADSTGSASTWNTTSVPAPLRSPLTADRARSPSVWAKSSPPPVGRSLGWQPSSAYCASTFWIFSSANRTDECH